MSEVLDGYRTASTGSTASQASNATAIGDIVAMEQDPEQQMRNAPEAFVGPWDFEQTERPIAYLNLRKNHVQQWKAEEIVPTITFENPSELIPKLVQLTSEDCADRFQVIRTEGLGCTVHYTYIRVRLDPAV